MDFLGISKRFKDMDDDASEYKVYELGPETDDFINDKGNRVQRRGDFEKDRFIVTAGCPWSDQPSPYTYKTEKGILLSNSLC